jgi:hypothetical protein
MFENIVSCGKGKALISGDRRFYLVKTDAFGHYIVRKSADGLKAEHYMDGLPDGVQPSPPEPTLRELLGK